MHYETDVAIIGGGPSGLFMVFEAGFLGYRSVVLDALPQAGGELVEKLMVQAAPYAPTYLLGEPVTGFSEADGVFTLATSSHSVTARVVVIAGGGGMFTPRKPAQLANLATYEHSGDVLYAITEKRKLAGQDVVIAGGGDSAVDWAVELAKPLSAGGQVGSTDTGQQGLARHVHVVHRRNDFRAADETIRQLYALEKAGKVTIHTPYQLHALAGGGMLEAVTIADLDGATTTLAASKLVCCFGLAPNPGPLSDWRLGFAKGVIPVDRTTMQTALPGVLCIGDMADYAGKVSLILTGFAEAAVAAKQVQAVIHPGKKYKVQYSTSKGVPGTPPAATL